MYLLHHHLHQALEDKKTAPHMDLLVLLKQTKLSREGVLVHIDR
jgi:hypothetical protein